MAGDRYRIQAKVWLYPGMAGWHFVTLPKKRAEEITERFGEQKRGWGSLRVAVTIGKTTWKTSIFPDRESGSYLLPLKAEVRRAERIAEGDTVTFSLEVGA